MLPRHLDTEGWQLIGQGRFPQFYGPTARYRRRWRGSERARADYGARASVLRCGDGRIYERVAEIAGLASPNVDGDGGGWPGLNPWTASPLDPSGQLYDPNQQLGGPTGQLVPVHNSFLSQYPRQCVGKILLKKSDVDWTTYASGALYGPRHVVTAGHPFWDDYEHEWKSTGPWMEPVFRPAGGGPGGPSSFYTSQNTFDGSFGIAGTIIPALYFEYLSALYDIAILILNEGEGALPGFKPAFGLGFFGLCSSTSQVGYNVTGYPEPSLMCPDGGCLGKMYEAGCTEQEVSDEQIVPPNCASLGGMSGGPVWAFDGNGVPCIFGVHTDTVAAKRINSSWRSWLRLYRCDFPSSYMNVEGCK